MSAARAPTAGRVIFDDREVQGRSAHEIARRGIARTFQNIRLFSSRCCRDNVSVAEHHRSSAPLRDALFHTRRFRESDLEMRRRADELLETFGLSAWADTRAGDLPYGQQRMLEIARSLATRPRLFMLDEPAAGLNGAEVAFLLQRLEDIGRRGITLVVVEHNMDLVMNVAQRVFVMDYGEPLFEGTPREVQANPRVIEAYLGGEFA